MKNWQAALLLLPLYAQIYWQPLHEAYERARLQGKPLLVYLYTPWCGPCVMMDQNTWAHPVIATFATANFHCARVDAEARDSLFFNGSYFPYLPELHANQLAYLLLQGKMEYPALLLMDPTGETLLTLHGYIAPRLMDEILRYFGGGFYRSMPWEEFQKSYPSQL